MFEEPSGIVLLLSCSHQPSRFSRFERSLELWQKRFAKQDLCYHRIIAMANDITDHPAFWLILSLPSLIEDEQCYANDYGPDGDVSDQV